MKEYIMEFIGAMFLVLVISLTGNPIAIGMILCSLVYIGGHVSGAHYNPAVTLSVWMRGKIKSGKVFGYFAAQILGAFTAALIYYCLTKKAFMPSPAAGVSILQSFLIEILFTFVLCYVVLVVATSRKFEGNHIYGIAIGFALMAGAFAGVNISGAVYNPAVALGAAIIGTSLGSANWVNVALYLIGPLAGGAVAALAFRFFNPD